MMKHRDMKEIKDINVLVAGIVNTIAFAFRRKFHVTLSWPQSKRQLQTFLVTIHFAMDSISILREPNREII